MHNFTRRVFFCGILCFFGIILTPTEKLKANEYFDTGVFLGASHYYGDLQQDVLHTNQTHPYMSAYLRFSPNEYLSFRGSFSYGRISGADSNHTSPGRRNRNLSFKNDIYEVSLIGEWNLFGFDFVSMHNDNFTPYVFAGLGFFKHNPKAKYDDEWVELKPLSTEGQGLPDYPERQPYSLYQVSIPHGVGLKYQFSTSIALSMEVSPRKTFTDYLDDVSTDHVDQELLRQRRGELAASLADRSDELPQFDDPQNQEGRQRGNPDDEDWYVFVGVTLSINLSEYYCPLQH